MPDKNQNDTLTNKNFKDGDGVVEENSPTFTATSTSTPVPESLPTDSQKHSDQVEDSGGIFQEDPSSTNPANETSQSETNPENPEGESSGMDHGEDEGYTPKIRNQASNAAGVETTTSESKDDPDSSSTDNRNSSGEVGEIESDQPAQPKKKKKKKKSWFSRLIILIGLLIAFYPLGANLYNSYLQSKIISGISSAEQSALLEDDGSLEAMYQSAVEYNDRLYRYDDRTGYEDELKLTEDGVMGRIEIPVIECSLPIYHTVEERFLSVGVGHMDQSSLPVGGENTHCALAGHSGLPGAKLFSRLDEVKIGDKFYIKTCGKTFAYEVFEIETVLPQKASMLLPDTGEDVVTLITCTPYGVNTHRLLVTGKRIPYVEDEEKTIKAGEMSTREKALNIFPFALVVIVLLPLILGLVKRYMEHRKNKKIKKENKQENDKG